MFDAENEAESLYSYLITEGGCPENLKPFHSQDPVKGLSRITVQKQFPFVKVALEDRLCVLAHTSGIL